MPKAAQDGVLLEYESLGSPGLPAVVLVAGLGGQLTSWDDPFCEALAARGLRVIRYDNRDSGLSTRLDAAGPPDLLASLFGAASAVYTLDELTDDLIAVLDAAGVERAHLVGMSMGGMIAQLASLRHPDRVLSVAILMSGPAGRPLEAPDPAIVELLLRPEPEDFAGRVTAAVELRRALAAHEAFDVALATRRAEAQLLRSYYPVGTMRQAAAILATPNLLSELPRLRVPALVVHGERDPLVPFEVGRQTAAAIPGARFHPMAGVGHDLPEAEGPALLEAICGLVQVAEPV
ncbi:MAG TPA: alpha/beta hydrolase [Candidatus Dormibacteraeota bacterium]